MAIIKDLMRHSLPALARLVSVAAALPLHLAAQLPSPPPDPRYKVDILLIVAHPDDESVVSGYLARAILDQHKRVAVIYGTRGDGGGNEAGPEQAAALGAVREIEARRANAALGIDLVWFLDGKDTPSQDVLQSLETWHHGASLEQTVRLIRLTRPTVIMTWLPQFVIGENHGDHQAAGVLATEAFDLAANPTAYPSQVTPARNRTSIANLTEGLTTWQPQKLYFFSDRDDWTPFRTAGPRYSVTDVSPATGTPYYRTQAASLANHLTQGEGGRLAAQAIKTGDYTAYLKSQEAFAGTADVQLTLGKSLSDGTETGDVFQGVTDRPAAWRPPTAGGEGSAPALSLGGPWGFYRAFARVHGIERVGGLIPEELGVNPGSPVRLPLVIRNPGAETTFRLTAALPTGWTEQGGSGSYVVPAQGSIDLQLRLTAPPSAGPAADLVVTLADGNRVVGTVRLRVRALGTMPL